jgi:hypothetical protein
MLRAYHSLVPEVLIMFFRKKRSVDYVYRMTPAGRKLFFVAVTSMIIKVILTQLGSYLSLAINQLLSTRNDD